MVGLRHWKGMHCTRVTLVGKWASRKVNGLRHWSHKIHMGVKLPFFTLGSSHSILMCMPMDDDVELDIGRELDSQEQT
jgi:hypothetical protein